MKIIVLRGRPTSGKTTALRTLIKRKELKNWIIIDHSKIKGEFGKEEGKKRLYELIKKSMLSRKNILTEETSRKTLNKYLRYYIKKYKYKITVFQFTVSTKTAYKRDIKRGREKWHPTMGKQWIDKMHKLHDERLDHQGIIVDTDKLNKNQTVNFIIKKLK
jgi:tRNA uridine 5-carbamoylmethylation protein Kti12